MHAQTLSSSQILPPQVLCNEIQAIESEPFSLLKKQKEQNIRLLQLHVHVIPGNKSPKLYTPWLTLVIMSYMYRY